MIDAAIFFSSVFVETERRSRHILVMQAATEERALQYASVARIAHPILSDSPADPFPAIQIPLSRPGRHLVVARMPVSRRSKVRWSAEVMGLGLAVQVRGCTILRLALTTGPHVHTQVLLYQQEACE